MFDYNYYYSHPISINKFPYNNKQRKNSKFDDFLTVFFRYNNKIYWKLILS